MEQQTKPTATDGEAVHVMRQYGGSFIKQLAQLWLTADPINQARVAEAFRPEFDRYRKDAATLAHYQGLAIEAERMGRN
ncbi:hypothetical protein [Achromobacter deleyi]|uniref:hypothetical protein n=1 Tax=Achromobacter deleyi TaxID=1353891 RepID=UPI001464F568|nr:hypothetical protein [Achromobacter deleyi]CAB3928729.1 hypothetical protein LMG3412_06328 [Achromobacter deleyi]